MLTFSQSRPEQCCSLCPLTSHCDTCRKPLGAETLPWPSADSRWYTAKRPLCYFYRWTTTWTRRCPTEEEGFCNFSERRCSFSKWVQLPISVNNATKAWPTPNPTFDQPISLYSQ